MQTQKEIIEEMAKYLGVTPADIDPQASLSDDLGLGPIDLSDLLTALSEKFKITFDPAEVEGLETVNDIIVMVEDLSLE
jgi:acyl carrier protein